MQIHGFADASFKTQDGRTRSVEGRILFLTNGKKASPILWKSKKISRVADSTKSAETLAMDKATDDAIFMARMVHQIYTGRKTLEQIPVKIFTDSQPLHDSIYSTKQVERKTMRHLIQILKDSVSRGEVEKFIWVNTKNMIADVLTKDSAPIHLIKDILDNGILNIQTGEKEEVRED